MKAALRVTALVVALMFVNHSAWAFFIPTIQVFDPMIFAQNVLTATVEGLMLEVEQLVDDEYRRMARRFWLFADKAKYALANQPLWRTRRLDVMVPTGVAFMDALNGGDPDGSQIDLALVRRLAPPVATAITPELAATVATLEMADSALKKAIDQTGKIRGNRRELLRGVRELESDVMNHTGSATAASEVIVAGELLALRQKQERAALLTVWDDLALVQTKRDRDVAATSLRMQMQTGRIDLTEGAATNLQSWRMP